MFRLSFCACADVLNDLDGRPGMYFVFHDLGVRTRGMYRLFFSVHSVAGLDKLLDPSTSKVRPASRAWASTTSDTFQVYTPAFFPGTMESTDLSRHFARQGMPIHLRHDYAAIRFQPYYKRPSEDQNQQQQQQQEPSPQQQPHHPSTAPPAQRQRQHQQRRHEQHVPAPSGMEGEDTDMDSNEVVTHITTSRPPPGHEESMGSTQDGVLYVTHQQQQELMNQS
ncbi:velvet factor-domain-containing protein, partial [Gaertneriomyces semiglobifer]